jgi:hypothetical protein
VARAHRCGALKVIACYFAVGGGQPVRWRYVQGVAIDHPDWLVTARAITAPSRISHRWHWTDVRDTAARRPPRSGQAVVGGSAAWQRVNAGQD